MTLMEILSTLLIGPLKLIFEFIFVFAYKIVGNYGLSVIVLSLVMNFLLLPLYRRTDAIQEASRDTEEKLKKGVDHIKKNFSGDERMMILQTYYRQNNYKPTDALNGSVSLLLEVPFFMAAYQFLSNLTLLVDVPFGPIADLSAPDGLLVIGGMTLNLLPVVMTVVNFVSSAMYLKGYPMKTKIQLYAMAVFFLVFLYESPSGLVLYWTMNNLFSLVKTLFYKLKNPRKAAAICASAAGIACGCFALLGYKGDSLKIKALLLAMAMVTQLPVALMLLRGRMRLRLPAITTKPDAKQFLLGGLFLTLLTGLLIPSTVIASAPQDFVDITYYYNPLWYCVSSVCYAAGMFLVWVGVFYALASDGAKVVIEKLIWILCGVMTVNYMFFGTDLGLLNENLKYEKGLLFTLPELAMNLLALLAVAVALYVIAVKWSKAATAVLLTCAVALGSMSVINVATSQKSLQGVREQAQAQQGDLPYFSLSKTGKNVVVIMLDRAMGHYVPHIMKEKPELEKKFDGFVHYSNTISFGGFTTLSVSALTGGYEYTPVEINKRADERLVDKHNEALKVMPVLFLENGYKVTVCDPSYANFQWIPDLSIYDDYPEINTFITEGRFSDVGQKEAVIQNNRRNFFCFSIMKSMPLVLQPTIYNDGRYNQTNLLQGYASSSTNQVQIGTTIGRGMYAGFLNPYAVLDNLPEMTEIVDDANTFLYLVNDTTHEPVLLQTPDYEPQYLVDNVDYDAANTDRFTIDGRTLEMEEKEQMTHYHVNMAALLKLGEWFDYLRENDLYDNTRIILVSDHGYDVRHLKEQLLTDSNGNVHDLERYFPLLMVKDFDSEGFSYSDAFMTNADVPTLALDQLIENPVNPFTGKVINSDEKYAHDQMIIMVEGNSFAGGENVLFPSAMWASVKENRWELDNWKISDVETVLTKHKLP